MPPTPKPSFATTTDYAERGFDAGVWTPSVLTVRLASASRWLRARAADIDERITDGFLDADLVTDVVCTMVARTVPLEDLPMGLESSQITAGQYSQSNKRTNPHGDFYLTKQEKETLGINRQGAFSVNLLPNPDVRRR